MWSQNHSKTFDYSISLHTDAICTEHGLMRHSGEEQQLIVEDSLKISHLNCVFCKAQCKYLKDIYYVVFGFTHERDANSYVKYAKTEIK